MYDPYSILEIQSSATDDEVKRAYRKLSRKYHPDANINNPNKAQAEEKFKQVQAAYDQIMKMRSGDYSQSQSYGAGQSRYGQTGYGQNGYGQSGYGQQRSYQEYDNPFGGFGGFWGFGDRYNQQTTGSSDTQSMELRAAENYINSGNFEEALTTLSNIKERNARWYFLSAYANMRMGNNVVGMDHARQAAAMEPGNQQYAQFLQQLQNGGNWYQTMGNEYGRPYAGGQDLCNKIICANCICMCCGGRCCCI